MLSINYRYEERRFGAPTPNRRSVPNRAALDRGIRTLLSKKLVRLSRRIGKLLFCNPQLQEKGQFMLTYYIRRDITGQWRWRLRAGNNRIIAESGESYHNRADCLAAIELVKGSALAPVREE